MNLVQWDNKRFRFKNSLNRRLETVLKVLENGKIGTHQCFENGGKAKGINLHNVSVKCTGARFHLYNRYGLDMLYYCINNFILIFQLILNLILLDNVWQTIWNFWHQNHGNGAFGNFYYKPFIVSSLSYFLYNRFFLLIFQTLFGNKCEKMLRIFKLIYVEWFISPIKILIRKWFGQIFFTKMI